MSREDYVYHYTNLCALKGILSSKVLRLSSCRDYKDANAESEALACLIRYNLEKKDFRNSLCRFIGHYTNKDEHCFDNDELIKQIVDIRANSFMACFSKVNNNEKLWSDYADNGCGVVLAFDKKYINLPNATAQDPDGRKTEARWTDMCYGEEKFVESISMNRGGKNTLVFQIDSYKSKKYEAEQEIRLIAYFDPEVSVNNCTPLYFEDDYNKILRKFNYKISIVEFELFPKYTYKEYCDTTFAIRKIYYKNEGIKGYIQYLLDKYNLADQIIPEKM